MSLPFSVPSEVFSFKKTKEEERRICCASMDETEFQRLLQLFPVVRCRDYCAHAAVSRRIPPGVAQNELKEWQDAWDERDNKDSEKQGINQHDSFWSKLKSEAAKKVGAEEADIFCKAFQQIHQKLVNEVLSLDAARSFLKSS
ncbi:unnamed protein product [Sphenostylis stenocarpa]|uniref:Uncharacterized protein n=1 Tax=Sphenostylis stenocarpa TaxID=92480 RepID=A0AA86VS00_9FABA|nr:unnamed protein product [Sphenostylis stenocarpa]